MTSARGPRVPQVPQHPVAMNIVLTRNSTIQFSVYNIVSWVNRVLKTDVQKIEDLCTGAAYCNLMDMLFANVVRMNKVKWMCTDQKDFLYNFKILQQAFTAVKIDPPLDVTEIVKQGYRENYKFGNWFRAFFNTNFRKIRDGYNAVEARNFKTIGLRISKTGRPSNVRRNGNRNANTTDRRPLTSQSLRTIQPFTETSRISRSSTHVLDRSRQRQRMDAPRAGAGLDRPRRERREPTPYSTRRERREPTPYSTTRTTRDTLQTLHRGMMIDRHAPLAERFPREHNPRSTFNYQYVDRDLDLQLQSEIQEMQRRSTQQGAQITEIREEIQSPLPIPSAPPLEDLEEEEPVDAQQQSDGSDPPTYRYNADERPRNTDIRGSESYIISTPTVLHTLPKIDKSKWPPMEQRNKKWMMEQLFPETGTGNAEASTSNADGPSTSNAAAILCITDSSSNPEQPSTSSSIPRATVAPQKRVKAKVFDKVKRHPRVDTMIWLEQPARSWEMENSPQATHFSSPLSDLE